MPIAEDAYPVQSSGVDTPRAAAGLVIGAVIALVLIARGFRGISAGGVSVGVR